MRGDELLELLRRHGFGFFAGVPDSRLKPFCIHLARQAKGVVGANEGNAVALAAGHYLATGEIGVCYLQNSGLGNAYNPLVSLAHPNVYAVPVLLIVGWRGEPDVADEPQHTEQGKITTSTLDLLGVGHAVLPSDMNKADNAIGQAVDYMRSTGSAFALLVRSGTIESASGSEASGPGERLSREVALEVLLSVLPSEARLIATTGRLSRELFELRSAAGDDHRRDFLTVGSMGHASSIALGVALARPSQPVICLDGDGAALMHLGALAAIGRMAPPNLVHVLFNNGVHESVGGQPTAGPDIDFCAIAKAVGYKSAAEVSTPDEIEKSATAILAADGPALLEIRVGLGSRSDLGRPTLSPQEIKSGFMNGWS